MSLHPIFASYTTAAFLGVVVVFLIVVGTGLGVVVGGIAIAVNWKGRSRRSRWRLALALGPLLSGAPALLLSIAVQGYPTIAGFPNPVLIPVAIIPLLAVPFSLLLWRKGAPPSKS